MAATRKIVRITRSRPTIEGAGVHLHRAFGFGQTEQFDPFLLLDDFRSANPGEYLPGFPWHPHRGIETITYMLDGTVEHGDSMGNRGVIGAGDVQWMTAGSGIIHQEMPQGDPGGRMGGFQLWANLPASHKMMDPRYRDVKQSDIPSVTTGEGAVVRVICGRVNGTVGPVQDIITDPSYLDVSLPAGCAFTHATPAGHTVIAYVISGSARFDAGRQDIAQNTDLVLMGDGDEIAVTTSGEGARFLLLSGRPLREPVAWYGPIVMNTRAELETAFEEYRSGTFVKSDRRTD